MNLLLRNKASFSIANAFPKWKFCHRLNFAMFTSFKGVNYTPLLMPKLSPTATESKIAEWLVKEGDYVEAGDSYCNIETDKASVSYDALENGYVAKIFPSEGSIKINHLIGVQVENESDVKTFENFKMSDHDGGEEGEGDSKTIQGGEEKEEMQEKEPPAMEKIPERRDGDDDRIMATPLAKQIAAKENVNLGSISDPSGIGGVITRDDVMQKVTPSSAKSSPESIFTANIQETKFVEIPLTAMRRTIASRLLESKQSIPHYTVSMEIAMDSLAQIRSQLNETSSTKISVNDIIIKACALAMKSVPEMNSSWGNESIKQYNNVDISVAVATESGLLTPIIHNANNKGLGEISAQMKLLASRAKENKLTPNEFIGGTFTISNLGMMKVSRFSAIINPPQVGILAIGSSLPRLFQRDDKTIETRQIMEVTLSCDHRVVDGAKAAEWLNAFKSLMENPMKMLL